MASRYDAEIFNTLTADINGTLRETICRYASDVDVVGDLGCGVGRFLGLVSGLAKRVVAVDFSKDSVELARKNYGHFDHVEIDRVDLSKSKAKFCDADVGLSINVLVMPDIAKRRAILKNTWRNIRSGGYLILVVPSLESTLYAYTRYAEWYERDGDSAIVAQRKADRDAQNEMASIAGGLVRIDDTVTKHFLREEALLLLNSQGFALVEELRVEYAWKEDITSPPRWMREPYPWDWLFVARRK